MIFVVFAGLSFGREETFFLKGLVLTVSRILIFIKMQLDERYTGELRGLLLERSFSFGKKFI